MPIIIDRVRGDLLEVTADAIVNPWNRNILPRWLQVSGGISGQLKQVTGPAPWRELADHGPMALGEAVETTAGKLLTAGAIIHVAGLNLAWRATPASVRSSTLNAVQLAESRDHRTLAIPLIGAGHGGLSADQCRTIIIEALLEAPSTDSVKITMVEPA